VGPWPRHPVVYEINTWVWLADLGRRQGRPVSLASVPAAEWDALAGLGLDAVWLMGVWERSPAGRSIALRDDGLMTELRRDLPDLANADVVGSAYCVRRYVVDAHLGGAEGLAVARRALAERGIRLLLDFVPNHVAPDHPWVADHPEYLIRGTRADLERDPSAYLEVAGSVYACGRDPYFPAWRDVVQLNAFAPGLRKAAVDTVASIAAQCDGIRCDMAMLLLNDVFARTWGGRAGEPPVVDYWREVIPATRDRWPQFCFVAEAYWDLEWELQQQGFDYCYDKRLYDRLAHADADAVRLHLSADLAFQERLVRFIENHDEPRAAATFPPAKGRAAAVVSLTLPGARLLHEGQLEGRRARVPVFLGRRPPEPADEALEAFYRRLLGALRSRAFRDGRWQRCELSGWPDNDSIRHLLAWCWEDGDERFLVAVNLSGEAAQARIQVPWDDLRGRTWELVDALSGEGFERGGDAMRERGLYVALAPWCAQVLRVRPPSAGARR
jgi:glycosidase